jgi:glycosyltransferase involved in cell wall biosynthesis
LKIKFYVTLDPKLSRDAVNFLGDIRKKGLEDLVVNIGEIPQQELLEYYRMADVFFFPSKSETFGNPLIEAMAFGLPILVPDLGYAHAVCEDAGIYYRSDDVDAALKKIELILHDPALQQACSSRCRKQLGKFPQVKEWTENLMGLLQA